MGRVEKGGVLGNSQLPVRNSSRVYGLSNSWKARGRDVLIGFILAVLFTRWTPGRWGQYLGYSFLPAQEKDIDVASADPAREWKDDIWPLYPVTPWDISTDFPYPRKLEYEVTEGTWLRLDVHPITGEIVFDMLGDIYCLPSWTKEHQQARPILLGIPHDSDPHFSPNGDRLVFRSDAELGFENIWVTPWKGCDEMALRPNAFEPNLKKMLDAELTHALSFKAEEDDMLSRGVRETPERKARRLVREGRSFAQRVTNETYRWVSDARFHPSGTKVIATKWYTSSRSLGAGEGWEYPVPSLEDIGSRKSYPVSAGDGYLQVGRVLPRGWTTKEYGNQQIGPEQCIWANDESVIYAKNIVREPTGSFDYSGDVHKGLYAIFQRNTTSGEDQRLVSNSPGGASRPEISKDGRTLAFVRRVRDKEALVAIDLVSGTIHHLWDGLTYDLTAISAPMGTYPSFSFTPKDEAIVIWSSGHIYTVPLKVNRQGEKMAAGGPTRLNFKAKIEKRLANTMNAKTDLIALETTPKQRLHAFKSLSVDEHGDKVVFDAAGVTYVQELTPGSSAMVVPVRESLASYYHPSFVPHRPELVLHSRWSDINFTTFEIGDLTSGVTHEISQGLPLGRYFSPTLCECKSPNRRIAFLRTGGDVLTGNIVATGGTGLYIADLTLPDHGEVSQSIYVQNVRFIPSDVDSSSVPRLRFLDGATKLLVQEAQRAFVIDLSSSETKPKHSELAKGEMSTEIIVVPGKHGASKIAFVDFMHVYLADGSDVGKDESVWSKPGNSTKGLARLSLDGGHDVAWSRDGKRLFWLLGPYLHSVEVSKLSHCQTAISHDPLSYGIQCTRKLLTVKTIEVFYETDIQRLKQEALLTSPCAKSEKTCVENAAVYVIRNATLLTMDTGKLESDLIHQGTVLVEGGIIKQVGKDNDVAIPEGVTVFNAHNAFVVPGFIDVHAHWNGFSAPHPAKSWELETFLAYGVTTLHNPSSHNVDGFVERGRVESGKIIGPRIFHTGAVVYGSANPRVHVEAVDLADARSTLIRIKAEGGSASFSYKNYNQPSRAARQRLILNGHNLSMIAVPEGGMNLDWDLTYIVDGMATVEHSIPIPELYDDLLTLYAMSGTGATPTHLVNYGGAFGEQILWARAPLPYDAKLRHFTRHDILETLSETTARPKDSFQIYNTSASINKLVERGLRAHIGAHGEPPLGSNYHGEMYLFQLGGMSNYKILQCATISAAVTLGLESALGSLTKGKLADLLVYPPDADILNDLGTLSDPWLVSRGGRVWAAATMDQVWPSPTKRKPGPLLNPE